MKSDLQIRAEEAAERFATAARKPIVIEFAGVPKAGKTTTLGQLQSFLKRCGFRVEVVVERASVAQSGIKSIQISMSGLLAQLFPSF